MSEIEHSLKHIKSKKNATADEINSTKQLAYESFYAYINDCFKDKENCFISNKNRNEM